MCIENDNDSIKLGFNKLRFICILIFRGLIILIVILCMFIGWRYESRVLSKKELNCSMDEIYKLYKMYDYLCVLDVCEGKFMKIKGNWG